MTTLVLPTASGTSESGGHPSAVSGHRKLNADVEHLIVRATLATESIRSPTASALSLTCREFYEIVVGWRWIQVHWPGTKKAERLRLFHPLPTSILRFIRYVALRYHNVFPTKARGWDDVYLLGACI